MKGSNTPAVKYTYEITMKRDIGYEKGEINNGHIESRKLIHQCMDRWARPKVLKLL